MQLGIVHYTERCSEMDQRVPLWTPEGRSGTALPTPFAAHGALPRTPSARRKSVPQLSCSTEILPAHSERLFWRDALRATSHQRETLRGLRPHHPCTIEMPVRHFAHLASPGKASSKGLDEESHPAPSDKLFHAPPPASIPSSADRRPDRAARG